MEPCFAFGSTNAFPVVLFRHVGSRVSKPHGYRGMSCGREGYISVDFHLEERAFSSYFTMLFDNKDVP